MRVEMFLPRYCIPALFLLAQPAVVQAQFTYVTNDNSITITGYNGPGGVVVIPDAINGYAVTGIGQSAFEESLNLTSVTIPNSVTNIGELAFADCASLTNIVIPGSVASIGGWAFEGTKVTTVAIPSSVTSIGEGSAFAECASLTNISVDAANPAYSSLNGVLFDKAQDTIIAYPDGLTNSTYAIPNSVSSIGEEAFIDCASLSSVTVPGSITNIGGVAFSGCARLNNFIIPTNVISIGGEAFWGCGITTIIIPSSVTSIGGQAFYACPSLSAVYVEGDAPPDVGNAFLDVPVIYYLPGTTGWGATFGGAPTMEETPPSEFQYTNYNGSITITGYNGPGGPVVIPGAFIGYAVTGIGSSAFDDSANLTSVTIPATVTNIGEQAFYGCARLASVTILRNVTGIGQDAFASCASLTNVVMPNSLTSIGERAFEGCFSLTSITIPASVSSIGIFAFASCRDLTSAYFQGNAPPDNGNAFSSDPDAVVYYLPGATGWSATFGDVPAVEETPQFEFEYATNNGSLTITGYLGPIGPVTIPATINGYSVTSVGPDAFSGRHAYGITSVGIPTTVTNIGAEAFAFCTSLTSAYFQGNAPPDDGTAFYGDPNAVVYYSLSTTGWGPTFGGAPTMGETPPADFNYETINGSVTITRYNGPNGAVMIPGYINGYPVTSIGNFAFEDDVNITSVAILNTVTNIGEEAFFGCSLTNVVIPNSVTSIGEEAFMDCGSLANIVIPKSVISIGSYGGDAFEQCASLTSISVDVANPAYSSLNGVLFDKAQDTLIVYPEGLTNSTYTIPNSVTSIGEGAFNWCTNLSSVIVPGSVTSIGEIAFYDCTGLTNIVLPNSVTSIGIYAFAGCSSLISVYFEGNAPPDNASIFSGQSGYDPATVYYLPGTTGWGATFGGAPTELWNPQAIGFTTAGNQFGFNITGPTNATIVVEACTNMANPVWLPVSTNTLSGSGTSSFSDPQGANYPNRYYRFSAP